MVTVHNPQHRRKPQAPAHHLRGEEGIEDLASGVLVHPAPVVRYLQRDAGALGEFRIVPAGLLAAHFADCGRDPDGAHFLAGGLRAVDRQIHDQLLHLAGVGIDGRHALLQRQAQFDAPRNRAFEQGDHAADQLRQVHRLDDEAAFAGVGQQLHGQIGGPFGALDDGLDEGLNAIIGGQVFAQQARVSQHAGQDVIEIVRDPAGQKADAFQALRVPELFVEPFALGDVAAQLEVAANLAVGGAEGRRPYAGMLPGIDHQDSRRAERVGMAGTIRGEGRLGAGAGQ